MIRVSRRRGYEGHRYILSGEVSKNAGINQVLNFPSDGDSLSLTALTIRMTFREDPLSDAADLTLSTTGSHITITDANTLTFAATATQIDDLCEGLYTVDIATNNGSVTTHLAQGQVMVRESPVPWS